MTSPGDITRLLHEWSEGNNTACEPLFEQVYPQLRQIAKALFHGENSDSLLQPTSVVNEFFLKMVQQRKLHFEDRQHFYSLAARLMRRILIDHARSEGRQKRNRGNLLTLKDHMAWVDATCTEIMDLDRVLEELNAIDPKKCHIVELRFFLGLTASETGDVVGLSKATVDRELRFIRGWVRDRLSLPSSDASEPLSRG